MKRISTLAIAATLAGTTLLAPAVGADPLVQVTSSGNPVLDGGTGSYAQTMDINVTGCVRDGDQPGYLGYFLTWTDGVTPSEHFEMLADENGGFTAQSQVGLEATGKSMWLRWYCANAPTTELSDDPAIMWLGPVFTYTIDAAPGGAARSGASRTTSPWTNATITRKGAPAATTNQSALRVTVDPNALPAIDKMGIVGPKAAKLKAKVDARVKANAKAKAKASRRPVSTMVSATAYAQAVHQVVVGTSPTARALAKTVARLDRGDLRVQVIEDLALTQHNAAWWNRR